MGMHLYIVHLQSCSEDILDHRMAVASWRTECFRNEWKRNAYEDRLRRRVGKAHISSYFSY